MKKILMITAVMAVTGWVQAAMPSLDGTNVVGFTAVNAPASANTIITVPFEACLGSGAGMLADLVATNGLTAHASAAESADQLIVLTTNGADQVYYYYWLKTGDGWTGLKSAKVIDGETVEITPTVATAFPVARGLGFWIKRVASGNGTLYVKGQVSSAKQATPIGKGLNLIGYGTVAASFDVNTDIDWTGAVSGGLALTAGDRIAVRNGAGGYNYYHFFKMETPPPQYAEFNNKWVKSTSTGFVLPAAVPAGEGFWYDCKTVGGFTFRPDGND